MDIRAQYELRRGTDTVTVEKDEAGGLVIPGTFLSMPLDAWLESGWTVMQTRKASDLIPKEAQEEVLKGRKILAIKIVREQTGLGLGEAKALVDKWASMH